jgi:hypothetical protein
LGGKFLVFLKVSFSAVIKKIFLSWRTMGRLLNVHDLSPALCILTHFNPIYFPTHCHRKILSACCLWYVYTCRESNIHTVFLASFTRVSLNIYDIILQIAWNKWNSILSRVYSPFRNKTFRISNLWTFRKVSYWSITLTP